MLGPDGDSLPWLGETFTVAVTSLPTSGVVGAALLLGPRIDPPLDLTLAGYPGCWLHVQPTIALPMAAAGAGRATLALPIPPAAELLGRDLTLQGAAASSVPVAVATTRGGLARIGARH